VIAKEFLLATHDKHELSTIACKFLVGLGFPWKEENHDFVGTHKWVRDGIFHEE